MALHSHLSHETHHFIDSLSICWTRFSEDVLLAQELESLKVKFQLVNNDTPSFQLKQYIIRAIFLEMLGYEASFTHIHAINLTQSTNFSLKKLGYLASLSTTSKFICPNFIENLYSLINPLLKHEKREIRVKALLVLYQMFKYSPSLLGDFQKIIKSFLNDQHLNNITMVANIIYNEARKKPSEYEDILETLVKILEGIFAKKWKEDQGFYTIRVRKINNSKESYEIPPIWIIIKLLQIIEVLVGENKVKSERIYHLMRQMLKELKGFSNTLSKSLASEAIVFQCMKTIFNIYPNSELIIECCDIISLFLNQQNEQKYMGIKTLLYLSEQNIKYINQYQEDIISCLENQDFMIKRATLLLLIKIANNENIGIVLPKLLKYLQMENDEFFKKLLIVKIFELFKKYTPDPNFFYVFGSEFLKFGGNLVGDDMKNEFIRMIYEIYCSNPTKNGTLIINFYKDLIIYEKNPPENLIQISSWILGEIGSEIYKNNDEILQSFTKLIQDKFILNIYEKNTLNWLLNSLIKINSGKNFENLKSLWKFKKSKDPDLAQRISEYENVNQNGLFLKKSHNLPKIDENLSFLNDFVMKFKILGYKSYEKKKILIEKKSNGETTNDENQSKLFFEGKKVWGDHSIQNNLHSKTNLIKTFQHFIPEKEKNHESKPIDLIQTPNEEFASKVFRGVLQESRAIKAKMFGIFNSKAIIHKIEEEKSVFLEESINIINEFNEHLKTQNLQKIEVLLTTIKINELEIESEFLTKDELKRLADNFSFKLFSDGNQFIFGGIKSNEIFLCIANENSVGLKYKFKSTSPSLLSILVGFIKEYLNKKGYKTF